MNRSVECKSCGNIIYLNDEKCPYCGTVNARRPVQPQPASRVVYQQLPPQPYQQRYLRKGPFNKWVALILCFFLGVFGVHKFYEDRVGLGLLYLFTFGLLGFGVFIDFIILLFKPEQYYIIIS